MVHVPVTQALPFSIAQVAKDGVFAPLEGARLLGKSLEEAVQFG